jgi:hypothetical protein
LCRNPYQKFIGGPHNGGVNAGNDLRGESDIGAGFVVIVGDSAIAAMSLGFAYSIASSMAFASLLRARASWPGFLLVGMPPVASAALGRVALGFLR